MNDSILEILRNKFPLIVANLIYKFYIKDIKLSLNKEFHEKLISIGMQGILKIKNIKPGFWIINYERIFYKNNESKYTSLSKINFERSFILKQNHQLCRGYKRRLKNKQLSLLKYNYP